MFGIKLKSLRKKRGKTQMQMVEEINAMFGNDTLLQSGLSAMENRSDIPHGKWVERFAAYFGIDPAYFVTETSNRQGVEAARQYLENISTRRVATSGADELTHVKPVDLWQPPFQDNDDYLDTE